MANPEEILREGDLFHATVEEDLSKGPPGRELIVSYRGFLFRVSNSTGKLFRKGDRLELLVVGKNPFELRLLGSGAKNFDRLV